MAHYRTSLVTSWSAEDAFAYMSDLRNFARWDPGVRAVRLARGSAPGAGSAFDVDVRSALGTTTLRYEVTSWHPPRSLVVVAQSATLISVDQITIEERAEGTVVTYDADLRLRGPLRIADPLLALAFRRIGDRAASGLERVLSSAPVPAP